MGRESEIRREVEGEGKGVKGGEWEWE